MDPTLQEFLRRAAFATTAPSFSGGFAPLPVTFQPPGTATPGVTQAQQPGAVPVMPGFAPYYGGSDVGGVDMEQSAPAAITPIENMATFDTPFGPITSADIIGNLVSLAVPAPINLAVMALTGQTIGQQIKGQLTPVATAQPISVEAFNLGEMMGIPATEAQGLIDSMGGPAAISGMDLGTAAAQGLGLDIGTPGTATGMDFGAADTGGFGGVADGGFSGASVGVGMGVE